jgi:cytosine/adenosine deaminase-related metal-dependent hydrolase
MTSKLLIRGGCVLTLGARSPNFSEADVLVENGRIVEVGRGLRARDAETVDATDTVVMPGFVDTHRHAWQSLIRNLGDLSPGGGPAAFGPHHRPDDVYAATLVGLTGAVEAGITTVVDWSDIQLDDEYTDAALQAHTDAGLRTVFVHSVPVWAGSRQDAGAALRRLVMRRGDDAGPTTIASGPPQVAPSDVADEWGLARELGLRIHTHAGSPFGGDPGSARGIVSALAAAGMLGEDVTLVHGTDLGDADLDAIASSGAALAMTPSSEMAGGLGSPPIQKLVDRGIRPGLGVDDERMAPGDIFAQMRATISLQHATHFDLKLAGKAGLPGLMSTREVIRYATVDGARVAGLGDATGSLEPGKQADIVILRTDRPNIFPVNDPIGAVVWGMDTSNVDWVFVAGRALMRHGALEADVARVRDLAIAAHGRVGAASGLLARSAGGGTA